MTELRKAINAILADPSYFTPTQEIDAIEEIAKEYASGEVTRAVKSMRDDPLWKVPASMCGESAESTYHLCEGVADRNVEMTRERDRLNLLCGTLEEDRITLLAANDSLSKRILTLKEKLAKSILLGGSLTGRNENQSKTIGDERKRANTLEDSNRRLAKRNRGLTSTIDALRAEANEAHTYLTQLSETKTRLERWQEKSAKLVKLLGCAQRERDRFKADFGSKVRENDLLEGALGVANKNVDGLSLEVEELKGFKSYHLQWKEAQDLADNLNGLLSHERTENTRLHAENEKLRTLHGNAHAHYEDSERVGTRLSAALDALREEYAQYRKRTGKVFDENKSLRKTMDRLENQSTRLSREAGKFLTENQRLFESNGTLVKRIAEMETKLKSFKSTTLREENEDLTERIGLLVKVNTDHRRDRETFNRQYAATVESLEMANAAMSRTRQSALEENFGLRNENAALLDRLRMLEEEPEKTPPSREAIEGVVRGEINQEALPYTSRVLIDKIMDLIHEGGPPPLTKQDIVNGERKDPAEEIHDHGCPCDWCDDVRNADPEPCEYGKREFMCPCTPCDKARNADPAVCPADSGSTPSANPMVEIAERELRKASAIRDVAYQQLRKAMGLPSADEIRVEAERERKRAKPKDEPMKPEYMDILFDGEGPDQYFVEVENEEGAAINAGVWIRRPDGLNVLRIYPDDFVPAHRVPKPTPPPNELVNKAGVKLGKGKGFWTRLFVGKDRSE